MIISFALMCGLALAPVGWAQTSPTKSDPQAAARFYQQAQAALKADNYAQAIALLKQAVALDVKKIKYQTALADAHFYRAEKLEGSYKWGEAIREYETAYATDKIHRRRYAAIDLTNIGVAYDSLSQYEKAMEYYV